MGLITRKRDTGEPGNPGEFGSKTHSESTVNLSVVRPVVSLRHLVPGVPDAGVRVHGSNSRGLVAGPITADKRTWSVRREDTAVTTMMGAREDCIDFALNTVDDDPNAADADESASEVAGQLRRELSKQLGAHCCSVEASVHGGFDVAVRGATDTYSYEARLNASGETVCIIDGAHRYVDAAVPDTYGLAQRAVRGLVEERQLVDSLKDSARHSAGDDEP